MIVIVCPGQGSQTPGFLSPWLDVPGYREHLEARDVPVVGANLDALAHG